MIRTQNNWLSVWGIPFQLEPYEFYGMPTFNLKGAFSQFALTTCTHFSYKMMLVQTQCVEHLITKKIEIAQGHISLSLSPAESVFARILEELRWVKV
jgi:hypothetical protein